MHPWLDRPFNPSSKKPPVDASQTGGAGGFVTNGAWASLRRSCILGRYTRVL